MYDLEHDDETVVISSLLKWLPAKVLYHMRHAARCALRVVEPAGTPLRILVTRAVYIVLALYIFQGTFNCIAKETRLFPKFLITGHKHSTSFCATGWYRRLEPLVLLSPVLITSVWTSTSSCMILNMMMRRLLYRLCWPCT
jgi:hypothetical protein